MPGICAIVTNQPEIDVAARIATMLRRMRHHDWYTEESLADATEGVGLGRVSLGLLDTHPQPASLDDGTAQLVMDGELYDYDRQRRALEKAGCRPASDAHAELLLQGYRLRGRDFFAGLEGKFVAVIWDALRRRLIAVNDRFGMKPLYWTQVGDRLLVASEIKGLLVDPDVPRRPSYRGIAQFFNFGQYLNNNTSLEAVRTLPRAGWLCYDVSQKRCRVETYHRLSGVPENAWTRQQWLDTIDAALKEAVDCRLGGRGQLGLSLSGGLDARTILGLIDHDRVPVTSVSMGIAGCRDHKISAELAALTNDRHHNYVLRPDFLDHFEAHLRRMVHLTDAQYLSQCVVMPTLPFYREQGIDVLLRGHAGELLHMTKAYNFSLDAAALALRNETELENWAFGRLSAYMLEAVDGPLLASSRMADVDSLARDSLREALWESSGIEPQVQRIWHLFITQRLRRETALSLVKFNSEVEIRLPYLDNRLVDLLLSAPPELKLGETIQAHVLKKHRPEFLDVPNVNTGTRIGAGRLSRTAASFMQRVLAKLGVPGYQPYERLGLWLRRELAPMVERILLNPRCLDRGIFHPETVRAVVEQHLAARRNHTFLLMALMIFELGQRAMVDEEPLEETY
jgi:asparagine synthase (glutamine-hydrolysing)